MLDRIWAFISKLRESLRESLLYVGTPFDWIITVLDIALLTLLFYYLLKLVRDSRAWQVLKGLLWVLIGGLFARLLGLSAISYLLGSTISLFAIAFVVLFQPELRRALEKVGRSGLHMLPAEQPRAGEWTSARIESIVQACRDMAAKRVGALIVIERSTPLGDLEHQENAVVVDAELSTTILKQIFYVGSPLHDGAVLIRGGRVDAARIHIPLTDIYHLRKDLGTRHRAAIGASEIGDTIAVVVSEERGSISICIEGRLYILDNEDALRAQLHRLLLPDKEESRSNPLHRLLHTPLNNQGIRSRERVVLSLLALALAISFWFYVQFTINPVGQKSFQVMLLYSNEASLEEKGLTGQFPVETIRLTLNGRQDTLNALATRDIKAFVDLSLIESEGIHELPVVVQAVSSRYTEVSSLQPEKVVISIRPLNPQNEQKSGR